MNLQDEVATTNDWLNSRYSDDFKWRVLLELIRQLGSYRRQAGGRMVAQ